MALTNYERQKRWREKNRVIYNLRRRNARKKNFPVTKAERSGALAGDAPKSGITSGGSHGAAVGSSPADKGKDAVLETEPKDVRLVPAQSSKNKTLEALRALLNEPMDQSVAASARPTIFRNDYGAQISERAWNLLQKKKQEAKEGGYELDEYSQ